MIFHNGRFLSCPDADLLVVKGDLIAAVGPKEAISEDLLSDSEIIDLDGGLLLPGFVDSHVHIFGTGLVEMGWRIDLTGMTREETYAVLAAAVEERGAREWVLAVGWDESQWPDCRYLSRRELDRFSPRTPVAAVRMDGHLLVVNSEGLRVVRELLPCDVVRKLVDAERGEIREEAAWKMLASLEPDRSTLTEALGAAARLCHCCGVTSVHTMTAQNRIPVLLDAKGRNRLRVTAYHKVAGVDEIAGLGEGEDFDGTWVRFGGVKAFADGSLGASNAAVSEPYADGGTGVLNHTAASLEAILRRCEEGGWQTAIHAIGDRAIEQVLRVHATVGSSRELRHRIEHFELPTGDQIERVRRLGLLLSMQPNFIGNWSGPGSMYERKLGGARDRDSNPLRRVLDADVPLAFGSDGMPLAPLYGLASAVSAVHESQRLTLDEAFACYTEGGAWFSSEDTVKGRLEVGALADLVIMDQDPRAAPDRLTERRIDRVYVGGECVYVSEEI